MKYYRKVINGLHSLLMALVSVALAIMIIVTALEVIRRYLFGLSFAWSEELVKYLMILATFLGGAVAYQEYGLVALDLLTCKLPPRWKAICGLVSEILSVAVIAILFWLSMKAIMKPGVYKQISIGLGISMAIPWAPMPIGLASMLLFSVEHFYTLICGILGKEAKA